MDPAALLKPAVTLAELQSTELVESPVIAALEAPALGSILAVAEAD